MEWSNKQISIMAVVAVTAFMSTFLISTINVALPAIEKSFDLSAVQLSWVLTAFLLSTAMFLLPVGRWGDLTGVRRLFKIGMVIFTVSSLLCAFSISGFWLIVFRFIQGIGAAFASTTGPAILVAAFHPKNRGRVIGISVSAVYLGLALGPFAGGLLTQYFGWRSIFLVSTALGIFATVISFAFLGKDEDWKGDRLRIDFAGTLLYMAGLVLMVYGSSRIPGTFGWIMLIGGALMLVFFWLYERRTTFPVFNTELFTQNRLFAFSNIAALINYSATFAIVFLLSLFLQKIRGLSPLDAGSILIAQPVIMAIFSPLAGKLSDRVQPRYIATAGMAMCSLGLFAFAFLTAATPLWVIIAILVWVGFGFALFSSPNMSTIMSSVDKSHLGLASGSAATMRVVGQIVSMTIATLIFALMFGSETVDAVPDHTFQKAVQLGFICFSLISLSGIYFSYQRGIIKR